MREDYSAACNTVAAFFFGYLVAYAMTRLTGAWRMITVGCVLIPLWTSVLVRSYAWIVLLQRNGIINNTLMDTGLISQPLRLIYTEGAVILAMTHVLMPFMIFPLWLSLAGIDRRLIQASWMLGAPPASTFLRVTLPLSLPGVFAAAIFAFVGCFGESAIPAVVTAGDS